MQTGKRAAVLLMLALLVLTAGCGEKETSEGQSIQQAYQTRAGFTAQVELVGQLDSAAVTYTVEYVWRREGDDTQTILQPEAVAGIAMTLTDGEEGVLIRYDGTELETAMPSRPGLTPADGIYALIRTMQNDYPLSQGKETWQDQPVTRLSYRREEDEGELGYEVLLAQDGALCYAEVYWDSVCQLQMTVQEFQWME